MHTPFPLIDLSGPPRERGRQYGAAAADRIHRSAEIYLTAFEKQRLGADRVRALVDTLIPIIERFEPAYLDEMRGIAEGAHCPLEHVVVVNARTELLAQARLAAAEPDGCTGAVVLPEASSGGVVLHGQNWDWRAECADTGVVLRIRQENGPELLTFTEAGGLARCGMNAAGIALTANFLGSNRDGARPGVPLVLLRRRALETPHFALAIQAVYATPKWVSNNIMLSHTGGAALARRSTSKARLTRVFCSSRTMACWCTPTISNIRLRLRSYATPGWRPRPTPPIARNACEDCWRRNVGGLAWMI
jgi:isopenicillin-N N-acyltransferase-like protein